MSNDLSDHPEGHSNSKGGAGRSWFYAVGLLVTIGIAGVVISLNRPEKPVAIVAQVPKRPEPAPKPIIKPTVEKAPEKPPEAVVPVHQPEKPVARTPPPPVDERGMATTRLALLHVGTGKDAPNLVALAKPTSSTRYDDILKADQSLLLRELIRQSLLIAARDELSLPTRDEVLDDATPAKTEGPAIQVGSVFRSDGPGRIVVRRGEGDAAETILDEITGPIPSEFGIIAMILPIAEGLSRTGFPGALKTLGLSGSPNKWKADGSLPPEIADRLLGLGMIDHFAAIRELHDLIRNDGESPERLGALARAYAQLGVLTEFHWHPAHKAYKARALLYAQRLVVREPGTAWALWNRAFVRSVIGLHQEALDDLTQASAKDGKSGQAQPPAWVEPIAAYARNELTRLNEMEGPHVKLAKLLRMLALEYPLSSGQSLKAAQEVVRLDEDCYRAHDAMCRVGGVGNLHGATVMGPEIFAKNLPTKLNAIATLPTSVKLAIEQGKAEMTLVEALDEGGLPAEDQGEPSWNSLAHLLRETRFIQVTRRLLFLKNVLAVPVEDFWASVRPFVAGHRYVTYLDGFGLPPQQVLESFVDFTNKIDLSELEYHESELYVSTDKYQTTRDKNRDSSFAMSHGDAVARDLAATLQTNNQNFNTSQAKVLLAVSPNSTWAQCILVLNAWDEVKDRAQAWEEKGADSPVLLEALSRRYLESKQLDRALALLRRCLTISPDHTLYKKLAAVYKQQGDMDGWLKTLEEYLEKGEDKGLDHASTRVEIARYHMAQKRWKEAIPYADAAAETWAAWAMICAMQCHEANEDWEVAETWAKRTTERYSNDCWQIWYCFCKRSGHGDIDSAQAWTDAYLNATRDRPDLAEPTAASYYYWLSGSTKRAVESFNALYVAKPGPAIGLHLMLVADEAGDKTRRDEVLKDLCTKMKAQAPRSITICERFREALEADKPLDLVAVDSVIDTTPAEGQGNMNFLVGKFLMNRGQSEIGRKYLQKASDSVKTHDWSRIIADSVLKVEKR